MSHYVPLEGFNGNSGSSLNFDIKAYTTQEDVLAATPKENTIGIVTDVPINNYIVSPSEPIEPFEGLVWICTGLFSDIKFDILKNKNSIELCPLYARQYINNQWVDVFTVIYQNNTWTDLINWNTVFITKGLITDKYGTFGNPNHYTFSTNTTDHNRCSSTITSDGEKITITWSKYSGSAGYNSTYTYFANKIDVTNISAIRLIVKNAGIGGKQSYGICLTSKIGDGATSGSVANASGLQLNTETILDVSSLTGSYYLVITAYCQNGNSCYLEIEDLRAI